MSWRWRKGKLAASPTQPAQIQTFETKQFSIGSAHLVSLEAWPALCQRS